MKIYHNNLFKLEFILIRMNGLHPLTIEEFLAGATKCNFFQEVTEKIGRELDITELKQYMSRQEMIRGGYCTAEEYKRIPTSTRIKDAREISKIMNESVCEYD